MSLADQLWCPTSVQVTVLQARGLKIKGKGGTNDAFAVMQVGKEKYQTTVAEKSVAPVWKEEATFDLPQQQLQQPGGGGGTERSTLHVHVLHRALVGPDKLLGQAVINLRQLSQDKSRSKTEWFKLLDKTGKADKDRGEVLVDVQFLRNNMTASMFDLSAAGKSKSRLGKFKDKVRKKKESDVAAPSFPQVLTDSEGEDGDGDSRLAAGKDEKKKKKKKIKLLFSPKSNLQRNMSQSMSVLPAKDSLSGSQSSGPNVDTSEGKKKFKFMVHKRSGSSGSKDSSSAPPAADQSNLCINGSHVYCEQPQNRTSHVGSSFSLASSGHGSMEDVPGGSPPSVRSSRTTRQCSPWTEEEEEISESAREGDEEGTGNGKEKEGVVEGEEGKRMDGEENARMEEEEERILGEEGRRREEEKRRQDEKQRWLKEKARMEEEQIRVEEERRKEKMRLEEEERRLEEKARREEEKKEERRREEERKNREEETVRKEEDRRKEMERRVEEEDRRIKEMARKAEERKKEMERKRIEEARKEEELRKEIERRRVEEEERERKEEEMRMEMERVEEEERERKEEEMKELECKRVEEERARREEEMRKEIERRVEEEERARKEEEMKELERKRVEEEERARKEEEMRKEMERRVEEEERARREEEMRKELERKRAEEEERARKEEEMRKEMERRVEEERARKEEEMKELECKRVEEEERARKEEVMKELERSKMEEEEKKRCNENARKEERRKEEKRRIEEESFKKEMLDRQEQEKMMQMKEKRRQQEEDKKEERARSGGEEYVRMIKEMKKQEEKGENGIIEERMTGKDQRIREEKEREDERLLAENTEEMEKKTTNFPSEEQMKNVTEMKTDGVASSNPFDETVSSSPAGTSVCSDPPRTLRRSRASSSDDTDQGGSQREKRPAPQPPDVGALLPHSSFPAPTPVSGADPQKSSMQTSSLKVTLNQAHHGKGPAPARPGPGATSPPPSKAPSSEGHREPVAHGYNPFEDDEDNGLPAQDGANSGSQQWPPAAASHEKVKSSKKARAPPLPEVSDSSSVSVSRRPGGDAGQAGTDPGEHLRDACSVSEAKPATPQLSGGKKDEPPATKRRLLPVKPLNSLRQSVNQGGKDVKAIGILGDEPKNTKVDPEMKGPYAQLTKAELISLVLKQENQLLEKDAKISELEQYIDSLLVRVMEEKPSILMSMNSLKKSV